MSILLKLLLRLTALTLTALSCYAFYRYEDNKQIDHLYSKVSDPFFSFGLDSNGISPTDPISGVAAVRKLGTHHSKHATHDLILIAMRFAEPIRATALEELAKRRDPELIAPLADLLQPSIDLNTRQVAADILHQQPCDATCNRTVLHYLERISRGELNDEDRIPDISPRANESASVRQMIDESNKLSHAKRKQNQQKLYDTLYSILQNSPQLTLLNLVKIYGLGSADPDASGLQVATRINVPEACTFLLQSDSELKSPSGAFSPRHVAPQELRDELASAIASLHCK